jgi:hypothetical protein
MKRYNVYPLLSYTLFLSSFFVPIAGFIASLFAGHFLVEYSKHKNNKIIFIYITIFLITFLIFYLYHIVYILAIIYPSILFIKYKHSYETKIVIYKNEINPVSLAFIPLLIFTLIMLYIFNFDSKLFEQLKVAMERINDYITHNNMYNKLIFDDTSIKQIINLMPAFSSVYAILITYITIKLYAKSEKVEYYFKVPDYYMPVFIVTGFLIILHNEILKLVGINSLIIFGILFLLQGMDIINYGINKFLKKKPFIKTLIYVIIISQLPCLIFLTIIGIFDNWFNFMKYIDIKKI